MHNVVREDERVYEVIANVCGRCRMEKWISVEDRLPKYKESVLIFTTFNNSVELGALVTGKRIKHKIWMNPRTGFIYGGTITHWMPLPNSPKESPDA